VARVSNFPMDTSSVGSFFSTRASSPSHHLVAHSVKRALHDFYILPSGTESVNQTPFADDRNLCPSRCLVPASTRRITGLPLLDPTLRAVPTSFERWTWCRLPLTRPASRTDGTNRPTVLWSSTWGAPAPSVEGPVRSPIATNQSGHWRRSFARPPMTNSNNAFVDSSSGLPRSALMVPWSFPLAGWAFADAPACCNALARR